MRYLSRCPLCECNELEPFGLDAWDELRLHVSQVRCRRCQLLVSQPQASPDELARYYASTHFEEVNTDPDANFEVVRTLRGKWDVPLMRRLWADWPPAAHGRALEIGCGYGGLLSVLTDQGLSAVGSEMSAKCAESCARRGFATVLGTSPGLPFRDGSFDLVVAMHVVEHVLDPATFVLELVRLARPGGVVVLGTEDAWCSQYQWDRFRCHLFGRVPPFRTSNDHTFVFRSEHLSTLLASAGCDAIHTRSYHMVGHESLHWKLYKSMFRVLDRLLGHGDFLMAVGHKPRV